MAIWLTAAQALGHLRETVAEDDPDLLQKMDAAEAILVTYVNKSEAGRTATAAWTTAGVLPADVQHALLLQLSELWRFRGDDLTGVGPEREETTDLHPVVVRLLRRWTDPVLA